MKKYLFIGILLTFTLLFADSSVIFFDSNIHTGEAIKIVINKKAKKTVEAIFKKATEDFAVAKVKKNKKTY